MYIQYTQGLKSTSYGMYLFTPIVYLIDNAQNAQNSEQAFFSVNILSIKEQTKNTCIVHVQ